MRGRYKIFLGMAAGVGKTYRMLQEGKAEQSAGREVVIGYLEPHERPETELQAEGIERLPRRQVEHRGAVMEEMDLPAIFQRAPELCLIDELAHSNAPGLEHGKRYEDIEDVLDAGIDVFSTVNVQHLESLNDRVAELTGVRVRETFPDSVLASADEVVLVDLTPEALIGRLRAGKVYPAERVPRRSTTSSAWRTWPRCARWHCARPPRRWSRSASWAARGSCSARARSCWPTRRRRRWPSACSRWSRRGRARSGSCGAPGARRSGWAPSSTCCTCSHPARRRAARSASSSRRCGGSPRSWAAR